MIRLGKTSIKNPLSDLKHAAPTNQTNSLFDLYY